MTLRHLLVIFVMALAAACNQPESVNASDMAGSSSGEAQDAAEDQDPLSSGTFKGMAMRNIGPALMAGRISDIVIVQDDPSTWYVAVGSGGVWKTENAGTTWTPLFDDQPVYSIGALAVDPSNANSVWVGTGENVGGRHVGFGDGLYYSPDGGKSWSKKGLEASEHISKILIHPEDPKTLWVASQGPLWSKGGERGLFKTADGGENWKNVLSAGEWTGVTDLVIDPRDPQRLYAATWQRHRTVAAHLGGGPESGLHVSDDGGETWTELTKGLPDGNMGKIGLAISPIDPDVLYAAIELDRREGGVWRSDDRGASWTKMSDAVGGGTGPHYYQEIYASPHQFDRVYLVSNYSMVSEDGGKTFRRINVKNKHVDDHAIAFRPDDPDYILFGCDGGLYETYDLEKSWRFIPNLPVTQFYKVAVDDAEPFYYVYGGTQDNNTQGGPSRTDNRQGVSNRDWFVTIFADGHQPATEPGNPDIMYSQWQRGNLVRVDRITGEAVHIQPQPGEGEPAQRFNWDAPILVSAHDPKRLYHASQRLWRSDDRGDSWRPMSGDLTRDEDRMLLPAMDRQWSWDAGWDFLAMSNYNTITSVGESPVDENLLYVGTDDGLIQVTEDGGATWRAVEVSNLPGVPDRAFVNDIKADLFDADTVYVALDNHKYGDYKPYLFKSTDRGRRWTAITDGIPEKHLVWRIVQDHEDASLLFAGTEFGVFFSVNGGGDWIELNGGVPTIPFRDLAIQRRENDLVGATFGRGFFILDDYTPLRGVSEDSLEEEALLFTPGRKVHWYLPKPDLAFGEGGSMGNDYYRAPNPPFGAVFTYYLRDGLKSLEEVRQEAEKEKIKEGDDTPFPGFDAIDEERREVEPEIWLTVRDTEGRTVRRIKGPVKKGFHRVAWDLRLPAGTIVSEAEDPEDLPTGYLVAPGDYTVSLSQRVRGETKVLVAPQPFTVTRMGEGALTGSPMVEVSAFWDRVTGLRRSVQAADAVLDRLEGRLALMKKAKDRARSNLDELDGQWQTLYAEREALVEALKGNQSRAAIGETQRPTVLSRLQTVGIGVGLSTYGPTDTHIDQIEIAEREFADIRARIKTLSEVEIPGFETALMAAGAPWTPGSATIPEPR